MNKSSILTGLLCFFLLACSQNPKNDLQKVEETTVEANDIIKQEVIDSIIFRIDEVHKEIEETSEKLDQALNDL